MKKSFIYLVFVLNLTLIGILWWHGSSFYLFSSYPGSTLIAYGRLFGLLGELCIALQLVLIGRIAFIEQIFGHDKLNRIHRYIGYGIALFLLGHPLLIIFGYDRENSVSFWSQFMTFLTSWNDMLYALIALCIFCLVIFLSLPKIRRKLRYETWYFTHLLMYIAIVLVIQHQTNFGDFAGYQNWIYYWYVLNYGALGLLVLYRFARPLWNLYRYRFAVTRVEKENDQVVSLYISGRHLEKFTFEPGQFANLTFLKPSWWFSHPFSFSAAPNGKSIRVTVKSSGDYTNKIAQLPLGTKVLLDGPLGAFTAAKSKTNKFLFLAGGIGITPIRALIEQLSKDGKDIVLLYANRTPRDEVFGSELRDMEHRYHFIYSQIAEEDAGGFETGRINEEKIRRLVPDFMERDIYMCGPAPMIKSLNTLVQTMGIPASHVHYEIFSY